MKTTKHSLLMSAIALLLCFSMLIGTTFAWFTDTVTSSGNIIKSGTLDVSLQWMYGKEDPTNKDSLNWKNAEDGAIFDSSLWEPGYTEVRHIKIENEGTLALKYALNIIPFDEKGDAVYDFSLLEEDGVKLSDVIDVYYIDAGLQAIDDRADLPTSAYLGTLTDVLANFSATANGELEATEYHTVTLALKMQETADNRYQNKKIGTTFAIQLVATQLANEKDSIDKDYDIKSPYPAIGYAQITDIAPDFGFYSIDINSNTQKVGAATVPVAAIADGAEEIVARIDETSYKANITVADGYTSKAFDITIDGIKENNDAEISIYVQVGKDFDPSTFKLYHYDEEIPCTYDPKEGYVIFKAKDFSPFTVVYDANSEYVPSTPALGPLPQATVEKLDIETDETVLAFNGELEAAYKFSAPDDGSTSPYVDWACDFFVKLDRDLEPEQIMLAGNYGEYNWISFTNGDITLPANTEMPLLGSVVTNDWTYGAIAEIVGNFICGVSDIDNALAGAKFTVMLRLTNPENKNEYYNVATVEHIFDGADVVTTADELKAALAEGKEEIKIGADITLTEGFTLANDVTFVGVNENAGINFNTHNIVGNGSDKITYKDLTLTTTALPYAPENGERYEWHGGIDYCRHAVANYENCHISGVFTSHSGVLNATGCTFDYYVQDGEEYYGLFQYATGVVNVKKSTFMYGDRAIKLYNHGPADLELNITDCTFTATEDYKVNKPLINIDAAYLNSAKVTIDKITVDEKLAGVQLHNGAGNSKVTVTEIVYSAEELQNAINNGSNPTLGENVDLNGTIVIP